MLDHEPGDCAQEDFGAGPVIVDVITGEEFKTWFFVMTLAWSRHQFVELVRDQKILTWLGCHRRAFEFFGGIPAKVVIDNPKAAITRACWRDPAVQRSYGDLVEAYGLYHLTLSATRGQEERTRGGRGELCQTQFSLLKGVSFPC